MRHATHLTLHGRPLELVQEFATKFAATFAQLAPIRLFEGAHKRKRAKSRQFNLATTTATDQAERRGDLLMDPTDKRAQDQVPRQVLS